MIRLLILLAVVALAVTGGRELLAPESREARVERVVDGDTLVVRIGDREETVRLIGIDTPEASPPECGNRAATRALTDLADGRYVELVTDSSQDERDRYGRLLRYVEVNDQDAGEEVLRRGWARVYVYADEFARVDDYRAAARAAGRAGRGLSSVCS